MGVGIERGWDGLGGDVGDWVGTGAWLQGGMWMRWLWTFPPEGCSPARFNCWGHAPLRTAFGPLLRCSLPCLSNLVTFGFS